MPEVKRRNRLIKLGVAAVVLAGLGYLFVTSLETTRAEPYEINRASFRAWELVLDPAPTGAANAPLLALRTDIALVTGLFRQVFMRTMESMSTPTESSVPIVLRGEFESALSGRMSPDQLLAAAREAGLEGGDHSPTCLVHQRVSEPGSTRQAYGVLMTSPTIERFRAGLAATSGGTFIADAMAPVMLVGASDAAFNRWIPFKAGEGDCVAPIIITGA
jgi:hypothetical protein